MENWVCITNQWFPDRVIYKIGAGSFGTVVCCEDTVTQTRVAIKVLHKDEDLHGDVNHEAQMYRKILSGCDRRSE